MAGLSVSGIINVQVTLTPAGAQGRSFGTLLILGDSNVITGLERLRSYANLDQVGLDFGDTTPEFLAADLYFSQSPSPAILYIGRWLRTATAGENLGGILSPSQQLMSNWTSITNGGVDFLVDGVAKNLTGLDFSSQTNLNGVASVITTAFAGSAVCTWNGMYFTVASATTGVLSTVGYATTGAGTNISAQLKMTSVLAQALVPGYASESPLDAVVALANLSTAWYGVMFAASTMPIDMQSLAVSGFIEATGAGISRIYGVTSQDTNALSALSTSDLPYLMKAAAYNRSFSQYSSSSPYAVASLFGRAFTVDFTGTNTTIILMFKQEPGIVAEQLTQNEALALKNKNCNVFVAYINNTNILQFGNMASGVFFDVIQGADWVQNAIQTACYNVLFTSPTKVPQTDAGVNQLTNAIAGVCDQAVRNGLVAGGTWNAPGFGSLQEGQFLKAGYYIFATPIALQSESDRVTRIAPPIQAALKFAGGIQGANILVSVNQ